MAKQLATVFAAFMMGFVSITAQAEKIWYPVHMKHETLDVEAVKNRKGRRARLRIVARPRCRRALWRGDASHQSGGQEQSRQISRRVCLCAGQRRRQGFAIKILIAKVSPKSRAVPKVFTERGLYMLATLLKGEQAVRTTLAIIETYAQVRELARTMSALQNVKDGGTEQQSLRHRTGEILANVVSRNLTA